MLEIHTFGGLRITRDAIPLAHFTTRKEAALLVYVACQRRPCPREILADLLWDDRPQAQAQTNLRAVLSRLNRQLPEVLIINRQTIAVNPNQVWLDTVALEIALGATSTDLAEAEQALALYQGDFLADYAVRESRGFDEWLLVERERYRALYLDALLRFIQQLRSQSEYERAIEFAQKALASDVTNERAHQHLMLCHLALGNRPAALAQYEKCERALRAELAVDPSLETAALYQWIKQAPATAPALAARLTNLPIPLTTFIGRRREMRELKTLLQEVRLVTLTGVGGSGKTRLAIQVATDLIDSFNEGVWWVDLAGLRDESRVPHTVAKALGLRELPDLTLNEMLAHHLRSKVLLLVLDNCEHLITACAQLVASLLSACPHLKILATSREALGIMGERVWLVPPLPIPEAKSLSTLLLSYESVRLFVERAIAVQRDFVLTEQNGWAVARICQSLDGIPLALELAAARVNLLTPMEIAVRLDNHFRLLTDGNRTALPRQQTLRALIDWSYDLLSEAERTLLRWLAVFAGGWTLEAAEQVAGGEWPVASDPATRHRPLATSNILDLLAQLVKKSLVVIEPGEETRYRFLETIRQYAHEKLQESDEGERAQAQHLKFFLKLAEEAERELTGPHQVAWLSRLETELDNLRAALEWSLEKDAEAGLQLASALRFFWEIPLLGVEEGQAWLAQLLRQPPALAHTLARAKALGVLSLLTDYNQFSQEQVRVSQAQVLAEESLALYRELEDPSGIAFSLLALAVTVSDEDNEKCQELLEERLALYRGLGDKLGIAETLYWLGYLFMGYYPAFQNDQIQAWLEEALQLSQELGNLTLIARALSKLGLLATRGGDYALAHSRLEEALAISHALSKESSLSLEIEHLVAQLALHEGDYQPAQAFFEKDLSVRKEAGQAVTNYWSLVRLGYALLRQGNLSRARDLFLESQKGFKEQGNLITNTIGVYFALEGLASLAVIEGQPERAARLFSWADAIREATGDQRPFGEQAAIDRDLATIRSQLDEATFAAAQREGRAMTIEQAMEYALEQNS